MVVLMFDKTGGHRQFGASSRETCSVFEDDRKPPAGKLSERSECGKAKLAASVLKSKQMIPVVLFCSRWAETPSWSVWNRSQVVNQKQSELEFGLN